MGTNFKSPARQGLAGHEDIAHAKALVFAVLPLRLPWLGGNALARLDDQLAWGLIHADKLNPAFPTGSFDLDQEAPLPSDGSVR